MSDKQKIIDLENRIHRLNEIGMALSTESDSNKLFEMILESFQIIYLSRTLLREPFQFHLAYESYFQDLLFFVYRSFY